MRDADSKVRVVFQDGLFDPSRTVERTLESGNLVRLRLEPVGDARVRILEYYRKAGSGWHRCPEEEGRLVLYSQLKLRQGYGELFAGLEPETSS